MNKIPRVLCDQHAFELKSYLTVSVTTYFFLNRTRRNYFRMLSITSLIYGGAENYWIRRRAFGNTLEINSAARGSLQEQKLEQSIQ